MKKISTITAITALMFSFVACKNKSTDQAKVLSAVDAAEFAAFQAWKEQQAEKQSSIKNKKTVTVRRKHNSMASAPVVYPNPPVAAKSTKKKMSRATKAAIIGGASGAVIGGVVNKRNCVAGVFIGGVLGAGAGYGIGKTMDNKKGR